MKRMNPNDKRKSADVKADNFFDECVNALKDTHLTNEKAKRKASGDATELYQQVFGEISDNEIEEMLKRNAALDHEQQEYFNHILQEHHETKYAEKYQALCALVNKLPQHSHSKTKYMEIIRSHKITTNEKIQKIIDLALAIIKSRDSHTCGFLRHFYSDENQIHRAIADVSLNDDEALTLNEDRISLTD